MSRRNTPPYPSGGDWKTWAGLLYEYLADDDSGDAQVEPQPVLLAHFRENGPFKPSPDGILLYDPVNTRVIASIGGAWVPIFDDADLDAVTVSWDEVTGKPTTFPPSAHTHTWTEITGKPTLFPPEAHTHEWDEITGKPQLYTKSQVNAIVSPIVGDLAAHIADTANPHSTSFLNLIDSDPSTYSGQSGKYVRVNATEDGLEFATVASGGGARMTKIGEWDLSVDTLDSGNEIVITGVDAYDELIIQLYDATVGSSDAVGIQTSTDGGSTWATTSGDYKQTFTNDVFASRDANVTTLALTGNGTTNAHAMATLSFMGKADTYTAIRSIGAGTANCIIVSFRDAKETNNAIRFKSINGNAFTGGFLVVYGR